MLLDSLKKRGDWWHCGGVNSAGTKIKRHSTKCADQRAALRYVVSIDMLTLAEFEAKRAEKPPDMSTGPTITEALRDWLKDYDDSDEGVGESTKEQYRNTIERTHIEHGPLTDQKVEYLKKVTSEHLRDMQQEWKDRGLSYNTIATYRNYSIAMFEHFVRQGVLAKNPWTPVKPLPGKKKPKDLQILSRDAGDDGIATLPIDPDGSETNWRRIKAACVPFIRSLKAKKRALLMRPESFLALLELMYETGLRRSDAIVFRPDWIEWGEKYATYWFVVRKGKHKHTIRLTHELADKLRKLPLLPWRGPKDHPHAGLYPFWDGSCKNRTYYTNSNLNLPLRALGKHLGFPEDDSLRPHRFRDSFAVNERNRGMLLEEVAEMLAHKDPMITRRHYMPDVSSRGKHLAERQHAMRVQEEEARKAQESERVEARKAQESERVN